ncbi:MAG: hypothetical protein LLF94_03255 [Chlamydiales bacterium]|nr:hypothetical protein [Chlamydiales bacterium]
MIPTIKATTHPNFLPPYTTIEDIIPAYDFVNVYNNPNIQFIPGNTATLQRFTFSLDSIFRTIQSVIGPVPARLLGTNILGILGCDFIETCTLQLGGRSVHLYSDTIEHTKKRVAATPQEFTLFFKLNHATQNVLPDLRKVFRGICTEETISEKQCQELSASFQDISHTSQELEYIERYSALAHKPREFLAAFKEHPDEFAFILNREFDGKPQTIRLLFGRQCPNFVVTTCALQVIHGTSSVLVYNNLAKAWYIDTMLGSVRVHSSGPNQEEIIYNQIKLGMEAQRDALTIIYKGILQDDVSSWYAFLALSTKYTYQDVLLLAQIAHAAGVPAEKIDLFITKAKPRTTGPLWQLGLSYTEWQHVMQCLAMASDHATYINTANKPSLLLQSGEYTLRFDLEPEAAFCTFSRVFAKLSTHKNFAQLVEALYSSRKTRIEPNHILTKVIKPQDLELNYVTWLILNCCSKELHPVVLQQFIPIIKSSSEQLKPALLQLMEVVLLQHGYPLSEKERSSLKDKELLELNWVTILQKCQHATWRDIGFALACKKVRQLEDDLLALQLDALSLNVSTQLKNHHLSVLHAWFHVLPDTNAQMVKTGFMLLDYCRPADGHEVRNCKIVDKILRNYDAASYPASHFLKFCHAYGALNLPTIPRLIKVLSALQDPKVDYFLIMHVSESEVVETREALLDAANRIQHNPKHPAFQKSKLFLSSFA